MRRHRLVHAPAESGFAMIISLIVLMLLTLLGMSMMKVGGDDVSVAGNTRASASAMYIAQAGIYWGLDTLRRSPFSLDAAGATPSAVLQSAELTLIPDTDPVPELRGWLQLPSSPVSFADGDFRVAILDDVEADGDTTTDTNQRFLLRSLGTDSRGSRSLVEVALTVQD